MASLGYFIHPVDLHTWLTTAQKSIFVKNKTRKELWEQLVELIYWNPLTSDQRLIYVRITKSQFVALQTFCMIDGKGKESLSSDQMLNFATTLDQLRSLLNPEMVQSFYTMRATTTDLVLSTTIRPQGSVPLGVSNGEDDDESESAVAEEENKKASATATTQR